LALEQGIPVWQPENLLDSDFLEELRKLNPDFQLVVAFRKLPSEVWDGFCYGTWNLHASLLPDLRGAAPLHWALRWGYTQTGLTVFRINNRIDTGDMLCQESLEIPIAWNAGDLHDAMAEAGGHLLVQAARRIASGDLRTVAQPTGQPLRSAPKISKEDSVMDWNRPSEELFHFVRAFAPAPGARTALGQRQWIVLQGALTSPEPNDLVPAEPSPLPGTLKVQGGRCWARALDGWLEILVIKPQNGKSMAMEAFLRGQAPLDGQVLG
jgi:methionyl-tRNA formyltransferase